MTLLFVIDYVCTLPLQTIVVKCDYVPNKVHTVYSCSSPNKKIFLQLPAFRACLHEAGGPQVGEVTCGGLPQAKCDQVYMLGPSKLSYIFGRVKRVSRERASERQSREGQRKEDLATISHKISFVLRPDEAKYNWLKNDVPENKVD